MSRILDPTAPPPGERVALPTPFSHLEGATLAGLTNRCKRMDPIAERLAQGLPGDYGVADVPIESIWSIHDQIELLKRRISTVVLGTERFRELPDATGRSRGMPESPSVVLPRTEGNRFKTVRDAD